MQVVQELRGMGLVDRAYVLGARSVYACGRTVEDDASAYKAAGIEPVFNRPLAQVLDLIRQAPLLLSIDTGIAHLAHYGGVDRHVLLYPGVFSNLWVPNPRAINVQGGAPISVGTGMIIAAAHNKLGAYSAA